MWIRNIRTPFRGFPMIFGTFWDTIGQGLLRVGIVRFGFSSDDREVPAELVCSDGGRRFGGWFSGWVWGNWPVLNSHWDPKVKPTLGCPRVNWSPEITCGHHCVVLMMSSTQTLRHAGQRIFHRTKTSNSTTEAIFTQWVTEWHSPGGRHPSKALTCGKPWGRSFPDSAP